MNVERLYQVVLGPHVSEKATVDAELNARHTFKVAADANKLEVKRAVEQLFSVKVSAVQIQAVKGKVKRHGQRLGKRSDWKKAVVRLADGHDIDMTAFEGS
ncbi:MAG: 50S ribosomal protein L23 [Pseudomonadota bacterium]